MQKFSSRTSPSHNRDISRLERRHSPKGQDRAIQYSYPKGYGRKVREPLASIELAYSWSRKGLL